MARELDAITLEVLTQALISVVREMRATVFRTAKSVAIWEAKDFSCGLFAPDSQVVAQSEDIGSHVVPLPWSVRSAMARFAGDIGPGDVILMNDPYLGGTHLNDVTIIYPVFDGGRLAFFPAVREHWPDVGGMVPGSMSGKADRDLPGGRAHPAGEDHDGRAAQRGGARHPARQHARARRAARRLPCRHRRLPGGGDAHPRADRALGPRRADGGGAARSRPGRGAHEEVHRRPARRHLPLRGLSGDLSRRRVRAAAAAAGAHDRRRPHDRGLHGRGDRRCRCPSTRRWRCRRPPCSSR